MARQILITGGTSGIGAGIAAAFAAQGDQVTVTGATAAEVDAATGRAGTTVMSTRTTCPRSTAWPIWWPTTARWTWW